MENIKNVYNKEYSFEHNKNMKDNIYGRRTQVLRGASKVSSCSGCTPVYILTQINLLKRKKRENK